MAPNDRAADGTDASSPPAPLHADRNRRRDTDTTGNFGEAAGNPRNIFGTEGFGPINRHQRKSAHERQAREEEEERFRMQRSGRAAPGDHPEVLSGARVARDFPQSSSL